MAIPTWAGKNATVYFFQDNKKVTLNVTKWEVKPNVTEINEGFAGQDRDDLQTIINFYEISLECKERKTELLQAMVDNQANIDEEFIPFQQGVAILIKPNDGTQKAFQTKGQHSVGAWALSAPARNQTNTMNLPVRAQYFDNVPGI
jgi:hypothetical protein